MKSILAKSIWKWNKLNQYIFGHGSQGNEEFSDVPKVKFNSSRRRKVLIQRVRREIIKTWFGTFPVSYIWSQYPSENSRKSSVWVHFFGPNPFNLNIKRFQRHKTISVTSWVPRKPPLETRCSTGCGILLLYLQVGKELQRDALLTSYYKCQSGDENPGDRLLLLALNTSLKSFSFKMGLRDHDFKIILMGTPL